MGKYSEYKNSDIPWIGDIPSHWDIQRGKNVLTLLDRPVMDNDDVITCFRDGEVTLRKNRREEGFTLSFQEIGYQGIEPGDLVVHGMDGFAGAIGVSDSRGKATPVLNVMDSIHNKRFLMYYLRTAAYKDVFMSLSTGIRVRSCDLRWNKLSVFPFVLPEREEQDRIAEYIDNKLLQINNIISEAKASIEEYKAWKASIIYEAVTKGLDPNVEMKDSGVKWISCIPSTWKIKRTKALFAYGKGLPITKENLVEEGVPVISYGQIHSKKNTGTGVSEELIRFVSESYLNSNPESLVKKGDILIADTSEDIAGCGNAVYVDSDMTLFAGYHTIILKSIGSIDNKYIAYLMKTDAWRSQIRANVSGVKLFSISKRILNSTSVILPDQAEQKQITDYLDSKCAAIDQLILEKELLIVDLEKYKKSLIFDVVTGKKKVY